MFELTINDKVYQFNFGMGFLRDINKTLTTDIDGVKNAKKNIGLQFKLALLMDGDLETLVEILDIANKGNDPRVTRKELDAFVDDSNTDIDGLFTEVLDFLRVNNATKKTMTNLDEAIEKEKAKQTA